MHHIQLENGILVIHQQLGHYILGLSTGDLFYQSYYQ